MKCFAVCSPPHTKESCTSFYNSKHKSVSSLLTLHDTVWYRYTILYLTSFIFMGFWSISSFSLLQTTLTTTVFVHLFISARQFLPIMRRILPYLNFLLFQWKHCQQLSSWNNYQGCICNIKMCTWLIVYPGKKVP